MIRLSVPVFAILALAACSTDDLELRTATDDVPIVDDNSGDLRAATTGVLPVQSTFAYFYVDQIPGDVLHVVAGRELGDGHCPAAAEGLCVDIADARLLGSATVDAMGEARVYVEYPAKLADELIYHQMINVKGVDSVKGGVGSNLLVDAVVPAEMAAGDLVISEVMRNPVMVGDGDGEWFEVTNTTEDYLYLNGLDITDDGGDSYAVHGTLMLVAPGDTVVFGNNGDPELNGGALVDHVYDDIVLANTDDELHLSYLGRIIDSVVWDATFPNRAGASMALDANSIDGAFNDDGSLWCPSEETFGAGDAGTPNAANAACF
jgi:hypothetical protein